MSQCLKHHRYRECVFQYMRALINQVVDQPKSTETDESNSFKVDMKRSGNENKNEILSILRHAIAKNIKLKSNIKTTRF